MCASALEQSLVDKSGLSPEEAVAYFGQVHDFYARLPAERFPALARLAPDMTGPDGDARFEFGIDVLLAGFEAASERERSGP